MPMVLMVWAVAVAALTVAVCAVAAGARSFVAVGARNRRTLCDLLILVEQPTEPVRLSDFVDLCSGSLWQLS
jgi:hypothetical protein